MTNLFEDGAGLVFMKIGLHAQEDVEAIIRRKQQEYEHTGRIFWGYGGNTCHPVNFIQPFAKAYAEQGMPVQIAMHKMDSRHYAEPALAKEYSEDGIEWQEIPKGIEVKGSRYAMVLGSLESCEFDLDLRNISVGIGPKRGRIGTEYIVGHVDKGCFKFHPTHANPSENEVKRIDLVAPLVAPYAVFLR